ncbi:MAG: metal ABC transporter ATP-binding protein [Anaerovoracaceae bacterium]|jgi:zinc transport system ATP-binding protein
MSLITCKKATFSYGHHEVLRNVDFHVDAGDYLCIVGENGAGKSTLVKGLLGLKKPTSGSIELGDGLGRSEIGYLPQQTEAQRNFPASVFEVVLSGRLNRCGMRPFYREEDKADVLVKLVMLGIEGLKNRSYNDLSGGQQQRVLLARALCASQKLILLDEPVTGLDPVMTSDMYDLIDHLNKKHGFTVIMVSHDIEEAVARASRILHLRQEQLFFGPTEEYVKTDIGRYFMTGVMK